jgi:hypothetical protein
MLKTNNNSKILIAVAAVAVILAIGAFFIQKAESPTINEPLDISEAQTLAESWVIKKSPTYTFDGMDLTLDEAIEEIEGKSFIFVFTFNSRAAGYGDRSDMMLAQMITPHVMEVYVEDGEVVNAITDGVFDEMTGEMIEEDPYAYEPTEIEVYFMEVTEGKEEFVAVKRIVSTPDLERTSLEELLKGILPEEERENLSTSINEGVEINTFEIVDGVAKVDFNEALQEGIAGSAWVMAIRTQIEKTLMQFESIDAVEISINGNSEEILQP